MNNPPQEMTTPTPEQIATAAPAAHPAPPPFTASDLARALGVSRQRVAYWRNRPGCPPLEDVDGWRKMLAHFGKAALPNRAATNPVPRLWFNDGAYRALERLGTDLPGRVSALLRSAKIKPKRGLADAMAVALFRLVVREVNEDLTGWGFEPFSADPDQDGVSDYPSSILDAIARLEK